MFTVEYPPSFNRKTDDYLRWKRKVKLWLSITDVNKRKHCGLIFFHLDEQTQDDILDLASVDDLTSDDGVLKLLEHLSDIFRQDPELLAIEEYEEFQSFRRPDHVSVIEYCRQFHRRYKKIENAGTKLADSILTYKLLESANLSKYDEQLVKAITEQMTYDAVTEALKKISNIRVEVKDKPGEYLHMDTLYDGTDHHYNQQRSQVNKKKKVKSSVIFRASSEEALEASDKTSDSCSGIEETYEVHERTPWSGDVNEAELHRLDTARKDETNCDNYIFSDKREKEHDKFGCRQHHKEVMDSDCSTEDHTHEELRESRNRRSESVHTSISCDPIVIQPKVQCSTPHSNKSSTSRVKLLKRKNTGNYTHKKLKLKNKKPKLKKKEWNWTHKKRKVDWHTNKKPKLKKKEWNWKHKKKKVDWHTKTQKKRKEKRFRYEDYQYSSEGKMHRKRRAEKQWKRKKKTVKRFRLKK